MAKEIVQYNANVAPSGISGEVFQPYKDAPVYKAPVMTPINIATDMYAADKKLGDTVQDVGEQVLKVQNYIKQHDADILTNDIYNKYETELATTVHSVKNLKRGTDAIDANLIPSVAESERENIEAIVSEAPLDEYNKSALRKVLLHKLTTGVNSLYEYQDQQRRVVETTNIQADYEQRESAVKAGADPIQQAAFHAEIIAKNQPGNKALELLHAERLKQVGAIAQKQFIEQAAYAEVVEKFGLGTGNADTEGAIKYVRDPKNLQGISRPERKSLEDYIGAQEAHDIARATRETNANYNADLDAAGAYALKGDMKSAVKTINESQYINNLDKLKMIKALKEPPPEGRSNAAAYLEGAEKMYNANTPFEEKKTWLLANRGQLNISDFKHLSNVGMSQERSNEKAGVKSGIDTIKSVMAARGFDKERTQWAVNTFEKGVAQYLEGKPIAEVKKYAGQVLSLPDYSDTSLIVEDLKSKNRMMKDYKEQRKATVSAPTSSKVLVGTQNGKPVYDVGGGKWQVGE